MLEKTIKGLSRIYKKHSQIFEELGIVTISDLMTYYPFRYDNMRERSLQKVKNQEKVVVKGFVNSEVFFTRFRNNKNRITFCMVQQDHSFFVSFFNQSYLKKEIRINEKITIYGKWDLKNNCLKGIRIIKKKNRNFTPVYHLKKSVSQNILTNLIHYTFEKYGGYIEENLPYSLVQKYALISRKRALYKIHFPSTLDEYHQARRRIVFEEFFLFQMNIQSLKTHTHKKKGISILYDNNRLKSFIRKIPFRLTDAQKKVTNEICRDLSSNKIMHRVLQGDVGCGKTVIASIILYATVTANFQAALMVPTELLARQHFKILRNFYNSLELSIELLTGSVTASKRKIILSKLKKGEIDILVGTHSLIQENVSFNKLGLVITDEQHRFGVKQRHNLKEKGLCPDVLFMTATPIPRTLAITTYGDMDISIIDEFPQGRIPVKTFWIKENQLKSIVLSIKTELQKGNQIYIICPLVQKSESLDVQNSVSVYVELQKYISPLFQIEILHGRMQAKEKEIIMKKFQENQIQILISTTVIEVGIDVPNATMMIIMNAERFGLAQLHQLRGRVGRGRGQSSCFLLSKSKNKISIERMKIMTQTSNGFRISEKDLELRGPGELNGFRQSGLKKFLLGDLLKDKNILEIARKEAKNVWKAFDR